MFTGWESPFYVKISPDTPNDCLITINVSVAAKNALNENDTETYISQTSFNLTVRRGVIISGAINSDQTWTADNYYILANSTFINEGVTVTVEPGVYQVVKPGVTLNINGFEVSSLSVLSFGSIVDGSEVCNGKAYTPGAGRLKVTKDDLVYAGAGKAANAGTKQLPYWSGDGFGFATITRFGSKWSENLNAEGKSKFIFYPIISDWTNTVWKDVLAEDSGVGIYIHTEIVTAADTFIYEFVYTDELMASWANGIDSTGCGTYVLKAKADDSISSITVRPYVKSDYANIMIYGDEKTTVAP